MRMMTLGGRGGGGGGGLEEAGRKVRRSHFIGVIIIGFDYCHGDFVRSARSQR